MMTETIPNLVNLAFTYSEKLCTWNGVTGAARALTTGQYNAVIDELNRRIGEGAVDGLMAGFEREMEQEWKRRDALPAPIRDIIGAFRPGVDIVLSRSTRPVDAEVEHVLEQIARIATGAGMLVSLNGTKRHDGIPDRDDVHRASVVGIVERVEQTPEFVALRIIKNRNGLVRDFTFPFDAFKQGGAPAAE